MKFLFLITTFKKNLKKCDLVNVTYGKDLLEKKIDYYFVSGDKLPYKNSIYIKHNESYEQLPLKTFLMLNAIKEFKYDYIIKVNDDTFVDVDRLLKLNVVGYDYIGKFNFTRKEKNKKIHFYKITDTSFLKDKKLSEVEWAEGGFYILSKKAVKKILSEDPSIFINTPETYRGEDEIIGNILKDFKKCNIKDEKLSNELHMDVTQGGISFHPIHSFIFESLYATKNANLKVELLKQKYYLNEYFLRDEFLKKYE